jgi:membrane dipeptidase
MSHPVIDHHCDLLSALRKFPNRSALDPALRCAIPQLRAGGVVLQALAIFTWTHSRSVAKGVEQVEVFRKLPSRYPADLKRVFHLKDVEISSRNASPIQIVLSIENASSFCDEEEPLEKGLERLDWIEEVAGPILSISLTWAGENRFGGGNGSMKGLTSDGERLLEHLHNKKIAVDFSHASDRLVQDILDHMTRRSLNIPVMASHSNFRSVTDHVRNLPDEIAQEIFRRNGVIGLNMIQPFVRDNHPKFFARHVEHGLAQLGGEDKIVFGIDFFEIDPEDPKGATTFYKEYEDASLYPRLFAMLSEELGLSNDIAQKIASQNGLNFYKRSL